MSRPTPKFKVGQIVVMNSLKKQLPFRILAIVWDEGWFYAWNRKNFASESMLRALTEDGIGSPKDYSGAAYLETVTEEGVSMRCTEQVHNDVGVSFHQCTRNAREGSNSCTQHSPEVKAERDKKQRAKWAEADKARAAQWERLRSNERAGRFHQRLVDALRDLRDEYESQKAQFGSDPIWKKYEDIEVVNTASALLAEIEKEAHG